MSYKCFRNYRVLQNITEVNINNNNKKGQVWGRIKGSKIWSCRIRYKYVLINSQYGSNMHANKQLVNSENWSLNYSVTKIL